MYDEVIQKHKAVNWLVELSSMLLGTHCTNLTPSDERLRHVAMLERMSVSESFWILSELKRALAVPGDICEFGVCEGATSALMAFECMKIAEEEPSLVDSKKLWLFDSFQGLPAPTEGDELIDDIMNLGKMEAYEGTMQADSSEVRERLARIHFPAERAVIVEGFIEETIKRPDLPKSICFALLDFDFYEPTLIGLDYLDRYLEPGGGIVVDDYGCFSSGLQKAVDEFLESHPSRYEAIVAPEWAGHFIVLRKNAETSNA